MSVSGVTLAIRTAIQTQISASGLRCLKYDVADVGPGPVATIGAPKWELFEGPDQKYGVRIIEFPIFVYQQVTSNNETALGYLDSNFETVVNALGADRTLGGKAPSSEIVGPVGQVFVKSPAGALYSVTTVRLACSPFPNAA